MSPIGLLCGDDEDAVDLVDLEQLDLDTFVPGGGQVLADVVGADWQLSVTPVGEDGQLHSLGAAVAEERVDGRADRAAGVEHVVDEDAGHPLEREVERRRADERLGVARRLTGANVDVVAVKGDVELAERDLGAAQLGDAAAQPLRERDASGVNADQGDALEIRVPLDDLVRDPRQRALDRLGIEDSLGFGGLRAQSALRVQLRTAGLTLYSFPASQDRVKGVVVGAEP